MIFDDLRRGDRSAGDRLMPLVYDELRALAADYLRNERAGHTLQPTALAHEAWVRLIGDTRPAWQDRAHFMALAARAMRRVLVDHARKHAAAKRGGGWGRVTLHDAEAPGADRVIDILAVDEALSQLHEMDERHARVVELRYFGGLTSAETAEVLGVARSTVAEDWKVARAWLLHALAGGSDP